MPSYTLTDIINTRKWQGAYGPMIDYELDLEEEDVPVYLTQKPETPAPAPGPIELEITDKQLKTRDGEDWTKRVARKPQQPYSGGGGGGSKSPEQTARIERMHAQEMTLRLLNMTTPSALEGKSPDEIVMWLDTHFVPLADWFCRDTGRKPPETA